MDKDSGRIAFGNLKRIAAEIGETPTDEELQVGSPPLPACPPLGGPAEEGLPAVPSAQAPPSFSAPQEMIDAADLDGDGQVSEQEFLRVLRRRDF